MKFYSLFFSVLFSIVVTSCGNSDSDYVPLEQGGVTLALTSSPVEDSMRSLSYSSSGDKGYLSQVKNEIDIPVILVLYKQSSGSHKVYKTTWKYKSGSMSLRQNTALELPSGASLNDNDLWVTAIWGGGVKDVSNISNNLDVEINAPQLLTEFKSNQGQLDIPYVLPWCKLKAKERGLVYDMQTPPSFFPLASIFRYKLRLGGNSYGEIREVTFDGINVKSNVIGPKAILKLNKPVAGTSDRTRLATYTLHPSPNTGYTFKLSVPQTIKAYEETAYYYFWTPYASVSSNRKTDFTLMNGTSSVEEMQSSTVQFVAGKNYNLSRTMGATSAQLEPLVLTRQSF